MKAPWSGQLSAVKTGWLVMLLFFGWLAYLLVPAPKSPPEPPPTFVVKPPLRLVELGLPDNPDLEHLPEYFALYADQAEWKSDKTVFAYWNPGSNSYSYFFEAIRADGRVRFRAISKIGAADSYDLREFDESVHSLETDHSSTHPLAFIRSSHPGQGLLPIPMHPSFGISGPYIDFRMNSPAPIKPPPPELKLPPLDLNPGRSDPE